jgi:hypothetical protein
MEDVEILFLHVVTKAMANIKEKDHPTYVKTYSGICIQPYRLKSLIR